MAGAKPYLGMNVRQKIKLWKHTFNCQMYWYRCEMQDLLNKKSKVSQEDFGYIVGLTGPQVSKYECGYARVPVEVQLKVEYAMEELRSGVNVMGKMKDLLIEMCETPMRGACRGCDGKGEIEVEIARPQGFNRDIGYLDTAWETCEDCHGDGVVDLTCVECGNVIYKAHYDHNDMLVMAAHDATLCEECLS